MLKKLKWYKILRALTPIAFTYFMIQGYMTRSLIFTAILLGVTFLSGAWFCGWLCPLGFIQEWIGKLARLVRLPRLRLPNKVEIWVSVLRYILLGLSFTGIALVLLLQTPYGSFMGVVDKNMHFITDTAWILLGVILFLSLFIDRPFCRYFCPEGAKYGILSLARVFTITRNSETCISCNKCNKACPSQIDVATKPNVRNAQCVNCLECIAACPVKGTLKFDWAFKK